MRPNLVPALPLVPVPPLGRARWPQAQLPQAARLPLLAGPWRPLQSGAAISGGTRMAFSMGKTASGAGGLKGAAAGVSAVAQAGAGSVVNSAKTVASKVTTPIKQSYQGGGRGAVTATGGTIKGGANAANDAGGAVSAPNSEPKWAQQARRGQRQRDANMATMHAVRGGDGGGAGQGPQLKQDED